MTITRHGDPVYLDLLKTYIHPPFYEASWDLLDSTWDRLTLTPRIDAERIRPLINVARVAYIQVEKLTGKSLVQIKTEARDLHIAKNAGYAGADQPDPWANFRLSEVFGINPLDGVLVRMSDKYIRTLNLRRSPDNERVGESLVDTLVDLAAYALIGACLILEDDPAHSTGDPT